MPRAEAARRVYGGCVNAHQPPPAADARLVDDLRRFLAAQGLRDVEVSSLLRYTVGFSWLTYGFEAAWEGEEGRASRPLILRLGSPQGFFAPYRAMPEFETLRVLEGSGVPVPSMRWASDDPAHLGAPFLIAEKAAGEAPVPWTTHGGDAFDADTRRALGEQFVAALAALHRFVWRGTPAADLRGPEQGESAALVEVEWWEARLRQWSRRRHPVLERALPWLRRHAPAAPAVVVVHGDYRIGNFLVADGRITAVLDWELVHRGDPHEDLGWLCLQAFRGRSRYMCHLLERDDLYRRYEELAQIPVSPRSVAYWEAFGAFKLACIHLAAAHAFERGSNDLRLGALAAQLPRVLRQADTAMDAAEGIGA